MSFHCRSYASVTLAVPMAEAAGLVLGAASIFSLFSTCLQCFDIIECSRNYAKEHTLLSIKYEVEKTRFLIWGDAAGLSCSEGPYKNSLDKDFIRSVVEKILIQIKILFNETSEPVSRYGLKPCEDEISTTKGRKTAITPNGPTLSSQHVVAFQIKVNKQQRKADVVQKVRWAIHDRKKFQKLVDDLRELIDGLRDITPDLRNTENHMLSNDINDVENPRDLQLIKEASAESNPDWYEAASLCIEASDRSSTGRGRVFEWIEAMPSEDVDVFLQRDPQSVTQSSECENDLINPEVFATSNHRELSQPNIPSSASEPPPEMLKEAYRQNLNWQPFANYCFLDLPLTAHLERRGHGIGTFKSADHKNAKFLPLPEPNYKEVFMLYCRMCRLTNRDELKWKKSLTRSNLLEEYLKSVEEYLSTVRSTFIDMQAIILELYDAVSQALAVQVLLWKHISDQRPNNDVSFTYSSRYFWCYHTLDVFNKDIRRMIKLYKIEFGAEMWTLSKFVTWNPRNILSTGHVYSQRRMEEVTKGIEIEIEKLKSLEERNREKIEQIKSLRDDLFNNEAERVHKPTFSRLSGLIHKHHLSLVDENEGKDTEGKKKRSKRYVLSSSNSTSSFSTLRSNESDDGTSTSKDESIRKRRSEKGEKAKTRRRKDFKSKSKVSDSDSSDESGSSDDEYDRKAAKNKRAKKKKKLEPRVKALVSRR